MSFADHPTGEELATKFKNEIEGRTVLVTGVTNGSLGGEFVKAIAPYTGRIFALGRNKKKIQEVFDEVLKTRTDADLHFVTLDLTDSDSVKKAAEYLNGFEGGKPIDVIVNNAVVNFKIDINEPGARLPNGWEPQFGSHHLNHFLLTSLLLPRLRQAVAEKRGSPQIINVSSEAHAFAPIRFDDPHFQKRPEEFNFMLAYGQSKAANVLAARALASHLAKEHILAYSLHSGEILTNGYVGMADKLATLEIAHHMKIVNPDGTLNMDRPRKTLGQGVATHVAAAFDPSIAGSSGAYLLDTKVAEDKCAPHAKGQDNIDKLLVLTEEQLGVKLPSGLSS